VPPEGSEARLRYLYWLHYAEGSAMPVLLLKLIFDRIATKPAPWPVSAVARRIAASVQNSFIGPNLKRHLDFIEAELGAHSWFAGEEFTAADVQMSFPLEAAASRAGLNASRPRSMAFLDRIHARDAYQRALARGGPYAF
jgi:glutathione S-transferase